MRWIDRRLKDIPKSWLCLILQQENTARDQRKLWSQHIILLIRFYDLNDENLLLINLSNSVPKYIIKKQYLKSSINTKANIKMIHQLFTVLFFFSSVVIFSKAATSTSKRTATYAFPESRNCNRYENAILRAGAKLAWSVSSDDDEDFDDLKLNEYEYEVPSVDIVDYNIDLMEATINVKLSDMESFTKNDNLNNAQSTRSLVEAEKSQDGRELQWDPDWTGGWLPGCCFCYWCGCCDSLYCGVSSGGEECEDILTWDDDDGYRRTNEIPEEDRKAEEKLRDIAIPIFQMLHVACVDAEDLIVMIG